MTVLILEGYGMPTPYETTTGLWTRRTTFFWAAVGATAGLGNLWQFPYLAGQHGGSLFLLLYLLCLLLVTLPLMIMETAIGRHARHGVVLAMEGLVRLAGCSRLWIWSGRFSVLAAFLVLSFTAVIGAVCLAYIFYGAFGRFSEGSEAEAVGLLSALVSEPGNVRFFMAWHGFFLFLVVWVSMKGVVKGLERAFRFVVPATIVLLFLLLGAGYVSGGLSAASHQLLSPRPEDLSWQGVRDALFHAFYTLGLGMGVWVLFGAYTPVGTRLKRSVLAVVLADTLLSVIAGLMIFSLLEGNTQGLADQGFRLLFVTLPVGLSSWPGSQFLIALVFLLVVLLVWTTSLAWLEPVVGWFREWTGAPRNWSAFLVGGAVWLAGLGTLLSFNLWSTHTLAGGSLFRWLELITGGVLIPLGSILLAVFTGWCLTRPLSMRILGDAPQLIHQLWCWVMRLVLPLVVAAIAIQYSYGALDSMCASAATRAGWCESLSGSSGGDPGAQPESPGVREPSEQPGNAVSSGSKPAGAEAAIPSGPSQGPSARKPEDDPHQEDILYDSV